MPPRDPAFVQLDFPELIADLIRDLQLQGAIGLLNFQPAVQPTYIVGTRTGAIRATIEPPVFQSAEVFSVEDIAPALGTVHATTGPLPAGDYDIVAGCTISNEATGGFFTLQHRNAADSATLAFWSQSRSFAADTTTEGQIFPLTIRYRLGLNERLRWINATVGAANSRFSSFIMAKRVVVP